MNTPHNPKTAANRTTEAATPTLAGHGLVTRLVQDAENRDHADAVADGWGKDSFPASDPPQNY